MMRPNRSCFLTAALLTLPVAAPATADQADSTEFNPMVVTASPIARPLLDTDQSLSVITRDEIRRLPVDNIADLLNLAGGVDVRQRGGRGVQADVGIRGTAYQQTLILLNGVRMSDPQTAHHNMNLPVPLAHIERIEILKGPGSAAYGPNATGGAINIITRRPTTLEGGAHARAGSYAYEDYGVWGGGGDADGSQLFSVSQRSSDGHISDEPTDFDIRTGSYTGHTDIGAHQLTWGLGFDHKQFGAFKFYTADFPDQREETRALSGYASGDISAGAWSVTPNVFWRRHEDWFQTRDQAFVDDFGLPSDTIINEHETDVIGTRVGGQRQWLGGITSVGASFTDERIESNALGDHDRQESSAWAEQRFFPGHRLTVGLSAAVVDYSDFGSEFLPGLSLSWMFTDELKGFASAARSTRIPSYTELFLATGGNAGNADLEPERSTFAETGLRWNRGPQTLSGAVFYRRTKDLIDWSREEGETQWQADNFDSHRTWGSEVEWVMHGNWRGPVSTTRLSWTWLNTELRLAEDEEIKYAMDYPRHEIAGTVILDWLPTLSQSVQVRYADRRGRESATLVASRIGWTRGNVEYTLEGTNLLDEDYTEAGFAPLPGRWLIGGLNISF